MTIVRELLNWNDGELKKIKPEDKNALFKYAKHGFIEGVIDGLFICGVSLAISRILNFRKK